MQFNKEVIITTRVDKKVADELKRIAKQKQLRFSSYVRRVLVAETEKKKEQSK